jgi:hypothetical protein
VIGLPLAFALNRSFKGKRLVYPGPVTAASDEVYQQFVLIDAVAQFCADRTGLEQAMRWTDDKLKGSYSKFA